MALINYVPINSELKNNISKFYYFDNKELINPYKIYPGNATVLTIYEGTKISIEDVNITITNAKDQRINHVIIGPFDKIQHVSYLEQVNVFTIIFKPLGIYNFTSDPIYYLKNKIIRNCFFHSSFEQACFRLMHIKSIDEKFKFMEDYLLGIQNEKDFNEIRYAIRLIEKDPGLKCEEIANALSISKKSLWSKFKKYVGRTPSEFKNVYRFRAICESNERNLTRNSYDLGFFDQAHMIKSFKNITNHAPHSFLKKASATRYKENFWIE